MIILYLSNNPLRENLEKRAFLILFRSGSIEKFKAERKSAFSKLVSLKIALWSMQFSKTEFDKSAPKKSDSSKLQLLNLMTSDKILCNNCAERGLK